MHTFPITVIVPTFNRAEVLKLCLRALEQQTTTDFEVIVVNDGSTDGTGEFLASFTHTTLLHMRVLWQTNSGPACGRNAALAQTVSPVTLLIGDDILAGPDLVETHLQFHQQHSNEFVFALGWTQWDTKYQQVTPFMHWYENIQFDYGNLLRGAEPTWQHAYTSNLSFRTSLLQHNPYDERFRSAGWEDIELAFRLKKQGRFDLKFIPEAKAYHVHPTTFHQAIRRMQVLGRMQRLFHQMHPDAQEHLRPDAGTLICAFLGRHPQVLQWTTKVVEKLPRPGKLHSMILRGSHQRTYLNSD